MGRRFGVGATADQSSSSSSKLVQVDWENATGLLRIPLTELPNPQNAHVSKAELNLYAEFGSNTGTQFQFTNLALLGTQALMVQRMMVVTTGLAQVLWETWTKAQSSIYSR